jgi:hypothetical protein
MHFPFDSAEKQIPRFARDDKQRAFSASCRNANQRGAAALRNEAAFADGS